MIVAGAAFWTFFLSTGGFTSSPFGITFFWSMITVPPPQTTVPPYAQLELQPATVAAPAEQAAAAAAAGATMADGGAAVTGGTAVATIAKQRLTCMTAAGAA